MYPTGHPAILVKFKERRFFQPLLHDLACQRHALTTDCPDNPDITNGSIDAYLVGITYLMCQKAKVSYPADKEGLIFNNIEIANWNTPMQVSKHANLGNLGIYITSEQHTLIMEDVEGNKHNSEISLLFIPENLVNPDFSNVFSDQSFADKSSVFKFSGQKIAFAKGKRPGDTHFDTVSMNYSVLKIINNEVPFCPVMDEAQIRVSSIQNLLNNKDAINVRYMSEHFIPSQSQEDIFLKFKEENSAMKIDFSNETDKAGGIASPSINFDGFSKSYGPITTKENSLVPDINPEKFLDERAKLLGGIKIMDVLKSVEVSNPLPSQIEQIPQIKQEKINDDIVASFTWNTNNFKEEGVMIGNLFSFMPLMSDGGEITTSLFIDVRKSFKNPLSETRNTEPIVHTEGSLKNFAFIVKDPIDSTGHILKVTFDEFKFTSDNGEKPRITVNINAIEFSGLLKFVQALKDYIPTTGGFDTPKGIDITPQGITAGYSLAIPSISFGIFSLQNINIFSSLMIPFDGTPISMSFQFSERKHPFLVAVSLFGGTGYFGIFLKHVDNSSNSLDVIVEAALEFGGNVSFDLGGLASGGLYAMAGIYLNIDTSGGEMKWSGYLRAGGYLEVLGIIGISAEFYMGLTYDTNGNKIWGDARLSIEVHLFWVHKTVELYIKREFSASPPSSFGDVMSSDQWDEYCNSFEEEEMVI